MVDNTPRGGAMHNVQYIVKIGLHRMVNVINGVIMLVSMTVVLYYHVVGVNLQ